MTDIRQRLRVLEWAVGANNVMLVGLVLKLIVFGECVLTTAEVAPRTTQAE